MTTELLDQEQIFTEEPPRPPQTIGVSTAPPRVLTGGFAVAWTALKHLVTRALLVSSKNAGQRTNLILPSRPGNIKAWHLIHQVEVMRHLEDNWNGYGSQAPNDLAIQLAEHVVLSSAPKLAPTRVMASAQGGVAIYFVRGRKRGDIECLNTGELTATTCGENAAPLVWELKAGEIKSAIENITNFLER